jgi:type IV pilus biogenesis protein CpaD/CtpE
MKAIRAAVLAGLAAALAAACATTEPEPCTAEWVQYRKDRVLALFARQHGSEIGALLEMKETLDSSGSSGLSSMQRLMRLAPMAPKIGKMVESFVETAAPEVQRAVAQCGGPEKASQLFAQMLKQEGVDDETLKWVETVGALVEGWES